MLVDGGDESGSIDEVVLRGRVVALPRRRGDVAERHTLDPALGEELFGGLDQGDPGQVPST